MRALEILGVFPFLLPELPALKGLRQSAPHVHDVWDHTLSVIHHLDGILAALDVDAGSIKEDGLIIGLLTGQLGPIPQADRVPLRSRPQSGPKRAIAAVLRGALP